MIDDCWNRIGVQGDASCPKLAEYIHCRNCAVYSGEARELLDVALPEGYLSHWSGYAAQPRVEAELETHSVIIFRVDADLMALPTAAFKEVAGMRAIHTIPHRRGGAVLGVANIRGRLVVCVSLRRTLDLRSTAAPHGAGERKRERLLVLEGASNAIVCPVDEVFGIHRFDRRELAKIPATIAVATAAYTTAVLTWQAKSVALLDVRLLLATFERSLASSAT